MSAIVGLGVLGVRGERCRLPETEGPSMTRPDPTWAATSPRTPQAHQVEPQQSIAPSTELSDPEINCRSFKSQAVDELMKIARTNRDGLSRIRTNSLRECKTTKCLKTSQHIPGSQTWKTSRAACAKTIRMVSTARLCSNLTSTAKHLSIRLCQLSNCARIK